MAHSVWHAEFGIALNLTEPFLGHPELPDLWDQLYRKQPKCLLCMRCLDDGLREQMYLQVRDGLRVAVHQNKSISDHPAGESDEHKALEERIIKAAHAAGFSAEPEVRSADGRRRSDVVIRGRDGFALAAEVQLSHIAPDQVRKRSRIAVEHGLTPMWTTVSEKSQVQNRAPWARIPRYPWVDIASGIELPVRGGLRTLTYRRCDERPADCPDGVRGRCRNFHLSWEPARMHYDDLIGRAAEQSWVPLGMPVGNSEVWMWVSAAHYAEYKDGGGTLVKSDAAEIPELTVKPNREVIPLSRLCAYGVDTGIRPKARVLADEHRPIDIPTKRPAIPAQRGASDLKTGPYVTGSMLVWSGRGDLPAAAVGDPKPCRICGKPAILREPGSGRPCHKTCAEHELDQRAHDLSGRAE